MITETKEVYKCEHCRKLYQIRSACERHEPKCKKNPDNFQRCFGCKFLEERNPEVNFQDRDGNDHFEKRKMLYCKAKTHYVFPYWISPYDEENIEDEVENVPMPKECNDFKLYGL